MKNKTHLFQPSNLVARLGRTACGIQAWSAKDMDSEAETAKGERIATTLEKSKVTCKRCRPGVVQS